MILKVGIQAFMYQQIDLLSAVVDKSSLQNAFCICNSYIYIYIYLCIVALPRNTKLRYAKVCVLDPVFDKI